MKITVESYYGCDIRILKTRDGQEWINAEEFAKALEANFIKERH